MNIVEIVSKELNLKDWQVNAVISLSDEGCTVPFIARYRKEAHGSLDDQTIHTLITRVEYLRGLEKRRDEIAATIEEQGKMTDEIKEALDKAEQLSVLEDIYRPFRPKRRTRATVAKEKGLEPLAELILAQDGTDIFEAAKEYLTEDVESVEDAISGAKDIIAEIASDNADVRRRLRNLFSVVGVVDVKAADKEKDSVYTRKKSPYTC